MTSLARLLGVALWIHHVQAEYLEHGWVPEPSGRGTWSILWSCLATIFICTWSALHLDVPNKHGRGYLFFRKLGWMLIAATAPEIVLYRAADNFFDSRDLLRHLRNQGHRSWTLTHTQFAHSKGFWTRTPAKQESKCKPDRLRTLIENRDIDGPPISEDELKSRGQGDWVIKLIAIVQIIWFVVQTLVRAIQHFQTTALEIMTVAFVFCSVFIYGFSLNQPQDVEYPVFIEISDAALAATDGTTSTTETKTPATRETTLNQISDRASHAEEGGETARARMPGGRVVSHYAPGWAASTIPVLLFGLFACGFGAIHCLAWNSPFPTLKERLAWRICAATTTALPASLGLVSLLVLFFDTESNAAGEIMGTIGVIIPFAYILGRTTIIVLAFMSLRALPVDALRTVDWNNYIPHFSG